MGENDQESKTAPSPFFLSRVAVRLQRLARRFLLVTTILVGVACGISAVTFHYLIDLFSKLLIGSTIPMETPLDWFLIIAIPSAIAFLLAIVINRLAPGAGGANLARVRLAYHRDPGLLNRRTILATFLLTPLSLGSGAPLGPESPTVVVSAGLSVGLAKFLRLPRKIVRGMIPVGTAAGIAAIFNTPIAAVVFALEEILGTAQRGLLGGAIIASVAAAVVQRMFLGGKPLLAAPSANWTDLRELIGFAAVGILAGTVSGGSIPLMRHWRKLLAEKVPHWPSRVAIAGAFVGLVGIVSPNVFGVGYETVSDWLHGGGTLESTSLAFATKTIAMIVAVSAGMIGGTFAPSLFIGAALGGAVGHAAALWLPVEPGAYALVGMGAFFAGLLRNPIASVLFVMELTQGYELILPCMLAIALSISISRQIAPLNLVEHQMREEGFLEEEKTESDPTYFLPVWQVMTRDPISVRSDMTLDEVLEFLAGRRHSVYPVVGENDALEGILAGSAIASAIRSGSLHRLVSDVATPPDYVARSDQRVQEILREMADLDVRRCPVVAPDGTERLVGVLTPTDLLLARMRHVEEVQSTKFSAFD